MATFSFSSACADASVPCCAGKTQQVRCRDRVLVRICHALRGAERADVPLEFLHPGNCACNPQVRLSERPPRGHQEPVSLGRPFVGPGLPKPVSHSLLPPPSPLPLSFPTS